jgi:hypothetical protein
MSTLKSHSSTLDNRTGTLTLLNFPTREGEEYCRLPEAWYEGRKQIVCKRAGFRSGFSKARSIRRRRQNFESDPQLFNPMGVRREQAENT